MENSTDPSELVSKIYELEQKLKEASQKINDYDQINKNLKNSNDELRIDLQNSATVGQSLIEQKKELLEFKEMYETVSGDLERAKEESFKLRLQLDEQIHMQNRFSEQSEDVILKLERAKTETEIKLKRQKSVSRKEIEELHETLVFERAKSNDNLSGVGWNNVKTERGTFKKSDRKRKGNASTQKNTNSLQNSDFSDSETEKEEEDGLKKHNKNTSNLHSEFQSLTKLSSSSSDRKNHQNKNSSSLQKLIKMAGAIDESGTIRQLELERDRNLEYITKLENENKKLKHENTLLKKKNSDLKTEIGAYEVMNGYRDEVEKEQEAKFNQQQQQQHLTLEDELNSIDSGVGSKSPSEVRILKNAILQSQDIINTCISQTDEIQDQLQSVHCIVQEILAKNNLKLKPKPKSPRFDDNPDTSDIADSDNESCFNSPDNVSDSSVQNSDDLIASLLLLKDIAFNNEINNNNNSSTSSLHYKAEIRQLNETLARIKNELSLNQEQLMNTIQQKVKMQVEIEEWQEDMACMVSQNVRLSSKLNFRRDAQESENRRTANQRKIRLSEWIRQKVHSIYN